MSVVEVTLKHAARAGNVKGDNSRDYTRLFIVRTDNTSDDERVVLLAPGLPRLGNALAADLGARCNAVVPRQTGSDLVWEVTCTFSTSSPTDQDPDVALKPPLERPTVIRWGFVKNTKTFDEDIGFAGQPSSPYVNTFGDFFDPPPPRLEYNLTVTITRNEAAYDPERAEQYAGVANDAKWWVFQKWEAFMLPWSATSQFEDGQSFWEVVYEIHFKRDLWIPVKILNRGSQYWKSRVDAIGVPTGVPLLDGSGNKIALVAEDDEGVKHDGIVLLNEAGCKLPEKDRAAGNFHFVEFVNHLVNDFDRLNLP